MCLLKVFILVIQTKFQNVSLESQLYRIHLIIFKIADKANRSIRYRSIIYYSIIVENEIILIQIIFHLQYTDETLLYDI